MSQENVEVVRSLLAAFDRGDYEAALALIDPDVEWAEPPYLPGSGVQRGHEGIRRGWARWLGEWEWFNVEPVEFIDAGDRVMVHGTNRARGRASGVEVTRQFGSVFTVRAGKVLRHEAFATKAEALEAVGLSE
jgi:ketosteroid isomerase-like protein